MCEPCTAENTDRPVSIVSIETGPWTRRVELMHPRPPVANGLRNDQLDQLGSQVPLGDLLQLGLLHVDQRRGAVLEQDELNRLLHGGLVVGREQISTNVAHAEMAFVSKSRMLPFLADAGAGAGSVDESGEST